MIEMDDALKQLAGMKFRILKCEAILGGNDCKIYLPGGKRFTVLRSAFDNQEECDLVARAIEQIPEFSGFLSDLEKSVKWAKDAGKSYLELHMDCDYLRKLALMTAAIRGPQPESKEERYRKALEMIANIWPESNIAREALEAE